MIYVVTRDNSNFQSWRKTQHLARAGNGIHSACIGDDLYIALFDAPGYTGDERWKIASVAEVRIRLLLLLHDRHCDLGEVVEDKVVNRSAFDKTNWRFKPVAPEALAVGDSDHSNSR